MNSGGLNTDELQSSSKYYYSSSNSNQYNMQANQQRVPNKSTYFRNNKIGSGSNQSLSAIGKRLDGSVVSSSYVKDSFIQERHVREIQGAYQAMQNNQGLSIPSVSNTYKTYTTKGDGRNLTYQFFHNNTSLQEFEDKEGLRYEDVENDRRG